MTGHTGRSPGGPGEAGVVRTAAPIGIALLLSATIHGAFLIAFGRPDSSFSVPFVAAPGGQTISVALSAMSGPGSRSVQKQSAAMSAGHSAANPFTSDVLNRHQRAIRSSIVYPRAALRMEWEGDVQLSARIEPGGRASAVKVRRSSGHRILDLAAVHGVRKHDFGRDPNRASRWVDLPPIQFRIRRQANQ